MQSAHDDSPTTIRILLTFSALLGTLMLAMVPPVDAAWMSGRASDSSGVDYLAVVNDNATGERIELNCTPSGQAFVAVTWQVSATRQPDQGDLTVRFLVDGSRRFAAPARFRGLDGGWGVAELDAPEIILEPLTQSLSSASDALDIEVVQNGIVLTDARFDMAAAASNIDRYRTYCRL